jgi:hypothetical protein
VFDFQLWMLESLKYLLAFLNMVPSSVTKMTVQGLLDSHDVLYSYRYLIMKLHGIL